MENSRYLECLDADVRRLREVVQTDPALPVPSCPGWTLADLTRHVGGVYLHKVMAMREGAEPDWPPPGLDAEEPLPLLDRAYAELLAEFGRREPGEPGGTWFKPDQTVGFWYRRMAQETVIHRIDGELGAGVPVAPVPDDLALDGIDELLKVFVAYGVREWGSYFTEALAGSPGRTFLFRADGAAWRVRTGPGEFAVGDGAGTGDGDGPVDVTVSGPPAAVLRWLWGRETPGEPSPVTVQGPPEAVDELRRCITIAAQ